MPLCLGEPGGPGGSRSTSQLLALRAHKTTESTRDLSFCLLTAFQVGHGLTDAEKGDSAQSWGGTRFAAAAEAVPSLLRTPCR